MVKEVPGGRKKQKIGESEDEGDFTAHGSRTLLAVDMQKLTPCNEDLVPMNSLKIELDGTKKIEEEEVI